MTGDYFVEMVRSGLLTALAVCLPLLAVTFAVGVVMGALQTLFQVQDSIISQVPKLVAGMLTLGVCLPWIVELLSELFRQAYTSLPLAGL